MYLEKGFNIFAAFVEINILIRSLVKTLQETTFYDDNVKDLIGNGWIRETKHQNAMAE
ncbi:MAG: hypothetical protein ABIR66_10555 [Saprospiraceae bacterium]